MGELVNMTLRAIRTRPDQIELGAPFHDTVGMHYTSWRVPKNTVKFALTEVKINRWKKQMEREHSWMKSRADLYRRWYVLRIQRTQEKIEVLLPALREFKAKRSYWHYSLPSFTGNLMGAITIAALEPFEFEGMSAKEEF